MSDDPFELACVIVDEGGGDEPCGRDTVMVLFMGCVHEHMGNTPVCQFHVQCAADGELLCPDCYELAGERQHSCRLDVLAEVTSSGEIRVLQG
ncbi:hypothetical protein GBF35_25790 [Nonomuraea phyllanthi]|uniref:hypothetical protein n=1 Tax=Nonomuraea phyllanthi TaxID=2219224 RepID=UPI001293E708|nr:hypothetical protein [Nonomuraea phyllanthi]QFY09611.1 hypothetical protein GBF35_25790 [Nonomuraea phyllanthi]